jgi:hypothetical protein
VILEGVLVFSALWAERSVVENSQFIPLIINSRNYVTLKKILQTNSCITLKYFYFLALAEKSQLRTISTHTTTLPPPPHSAQTFSENAAQSSIYFIPSSLPSQSAMNIDRI